MRLGIFAKIFPGTTPEDVLPAARAAGYEVVQYNMACSGLGELPEAITAEEAAAVRAAARLAGVEIAAVSATYNMIHPDPVAREAGRRSFAAIAAAAPALGTRLLTLCTGSRDPHDRWRYHPENRGAAAWSDLCAELDLLLPIAERCDILLGVEPEPANVVHSARRARDLLETVGSERIRIVLDAANLIERTSREQQRAIVEEAVALLHDRISLVHAKDRAADGQVVVAGKGTIDFRDYLGALRRAGFDGPVVTHGPTAPEAREVAVFLEGILATLEAGP